ncbi:GGDEF domain-containing protein [Parathalassolituus penaei]|uniref:diguanylate cyclase n=1 Tax=Parathalassolituus penaei TaxID=2997323 RepID=A0A9X3EA47_9GAMM|nr:diguanylate cyclase [Parathalassolituus penaei]MCY0963764.1 diguanylate cyclase [Parathalassolituus penaei]
MHKQPLILVATPSLVVQSLLAELLRDCGDFVSLPSAERLLAWMDEPVPVPDLLILADDMPGLDLAAFLMRWRSHPATRSGQLVLMGEQSVAAEIEALNQGACQYLTVPLVPELVLARVLAVLRQQNELRLLRGLSHVDPLTGLANRRHFDEFMTSEWRWAQRHDSGIGVVMIDIDFFKKYNDRFGHQAGDECLCRVAHTLASGVNRSHDLVARYGGEEFAVIVPSLQADGVRVVAERLLQAVDALAIEHPDGQHGCLSISLGSSWCSPRNDSSHRSLIHEADQALYMAKHLGRHRHCRFGELMLDVT